MGSSESKPQEKQRQINQDVEELKRYDIELEPHSQDTDAASQAAHQNPFAHNPEAEEALKFNPGPLKDPFEYTASEGEGTDGMVDVEANKGPLPSAETQASKTLKEEPSEEEAQLIHSAPEEAQSLQSASSAPASSNDCNSRMSPAVQKRSSKSRKKAKPKELKTLTKTRLETPPMQDDENDVFGRNVAYKLNKTPPEQRVYAEKLINEILHNAQLDRLTTTSTVTVTHDIVIQPTASTGRYYNINIYETRHH